MFDKITSVFESYAGKIKNPFIGTIISVWLIHNWRIPYAIFNFDKECNLQDKINFIADYFGKQNFWCEVLDVVGYSFLLLILTFVLMAISRAITDSYYKIIEPFIIRLLDKNTIFTTANKDILDKRISVLEDTLNNKREEVTRTETNNQLIALKRDGIQKEFDQYVESKIEEFKHLQDKMDALVKKYTFAEKVTTRYDDVIHALTDAEHSSIRYLLQPETNLRKEDISIEITKVFNDNGFSSQLGGKNIINVAGKLFLDYYKEYFLNLNN